MGRNQSNDLPDYCPCFHVRLFHFFHPDVLSTVLRDFQVEQPIYIVITLAFPHSPIRYKSFSFSSSDAREPLVKIGQLRSPSRTWREQVSHLRECGSLNECLFIILTSYLLNVAHLNLFDIFLFRQKITGKPYIARLTAFMFVIPETFWPLRLIHRSHPPFLSTHIVNGRSLILSHSIL